MLKLDLEVSAIESLTNQQFIKKYGDNDLPDELKVLHTMSSSTPGGERRAGEKVRMIMDTVTKAERGLAVASLSTRRISRDVYPTAPKVEVKVSSQSSSLANATTPKGQTPVSSVPHAPYNKERGPNLVADFTRQAAHRPPTLQPPKPPRQPAVKVPGQRIKGSVDGVLIKALLQCQRSTSTALKYVKDSETGAQRRITVPRQKSPLSTPRIQQRPFSADYRNNNQEHRVAASATSQIVKRPYTANPERRSATSLAVRDYDYLFVADDSDTSSPRPLSGSIYHRRRNSLTSNNSSLSVNVNQPPSAPLSSIDTDFGVSGTSCRTPDGGRVASANQRAFKPSQNRVPLSPWSYNSPTSSTPWLPASPMHLGSRTQPSEMFQKIREGEGPESFKNKVNVTVPSVQPYLSPVGGSRKGGGGSLSSPNHSLNELSLAELSNGSLELRQ